MVDLKKISVYLSKCLNNYLNSIVIKDRVLILYVKKESLFFIAKFLKKNSVLLFDSLLDIWGCDYLDRKNRFEVNYLINSTRLNMRIWLKVMVNSDGSVRSLVDLYRSSGWLEREVWDMYGVYFSNNNDLRRILTDYGFEGHALRKDFPLSGYLEVRYDDGEKRVVTEKVELSQDFRYFNFSNPWERK